ncbi:hypothetical protein QVD17_41683 [Tagetes erecta]|uniref:Uncharacterized protein n=1 Tax=Tagetes erecta TaxID=13708 RepID=A0AAD8JMA8_TARER|nr:hypothetical protein QVD17_41683 [Tagetes erecta]
MPVKAVCGDGLNSRNRRRWGIWMCGEMPVVTGEEEEEWWALAWLPIFQNCAEFQQLISEPKPFSRWIQTFEALRTKEQQAKVLFVFSEKMWPTDCRHFPAEKTNTTEVPYSSSFTMSSAQKSSPSMFNIDNVDSMLDFHSAKKEKEIASTPPTPRAVTRRSKSVAHKRKKGPESEDDFKSTEKHFHEMITDKYP